MSDVVDYSGQFPILGEMAFFNHAGVAPISRRAADAVKLYADQAIRQAYVDSGWYRRAKEAKDLAAKLIGAKNGHEIALIPNTSTGISLVAKGFKWKRGDSVVITNVEYPANRYPWEDLKRFGVEVIEVPQQRDGRIEVDEVCDAIKNSTRIVSVSHVQYASGHRIDLKPISDMVHRAGGYLCVDAIQSVGVLPVDVRKMGIDFLSADGHKWMLAPEGCGIFYCREDLCMELHPNVVGWMNMVNASDYGNYQFKFQDDARRFEPGSYNIVGAVGMAAAIELTLEVGVEEIWRRVDSLNTRLCTGLEAKGYRIFSPRGIHERSGIVTFERPEEKVRATPANMKIVQMLEERKIVIVVREGRLRASPHFYNTPGQIDQLVEALP
jgi:selenocysteine lyase/cysteine desulfurase